MQRDPKPSNIPPMTGSRFEGWVDEVPLDEDEDPEAQVFSSSLGRKLTPEERARWCR